MRTLEEIEASFWRRAPIAATPEGEFGVRCRNHRTHEALMAPNEKLFARDGAC
jgi:hypothetical protein